MFAYTVAHRNEGTEPAQLLTRHWIITDGNGKVEEVRGPASSASSRCSPGRALRVHERAVAADRRSGRMRGTYQMVADDGTEFDASIPEFTLSIPRTLH